MLSVLLPRLLGFSAAFRGADATVQQVLNIFEKALVAARPAHVCLLADLRREFAFVRLG